MTKFRHEIKLLILCSLVIFTQKTLFIFTYNLIFIDDIFNLPNAFTFLVTTLTLGQIYGLLNGKKYTWILSSIQVALILVYSQGTFSWLFTYILEPLKFLGLSYSYLVAVCLIVAEIYKTLWLYKDLK